MAGASPVASSIVTPASADLGSEAIDRPGGDIDEVDGCQREGEASRLELGQVEQVAHQALQPSSLAQDDVAALGRVGQRAVGDRLGVPADRRERCSQVVAHRQ